MTRQHGVRRLGAVLSIFAAGFYLATAEPATPKPLGDILTPAVAGEPVTQPLPVGPALETVAVVAAVQEPPDPAPDPAPEPEPEPCTDALASVAAAGLALPDGIGYRCPSRQFAHHGAACWDAWPCRGSAFIAVNLDLGAGATPEYLRHVVAHEICHILDFRDLGWTTEPRADACAADYGF